MFIIYKVKLGGRRGGGEKEFKITQLLQDITSESGLRFGRLKELRLHTATEFRVQVCFVDLSRTICFYIWCEVKGPPGKRCNEPQSIPLAHLV